MNIAVVVPVRNGARFLPTAWESLRVQNRPADEVTIVVDTTSRDDTVTVAHALADADGARIVAQTGVGIADAINVGIDATACDVVAFLSCDDEMSPGALAAHHKALTAHPDAGYSLGMVSYFVDPVTGPPPGWRAELLESPRQVRMIETTAVRRSTFDVVGGHRSQMGASSDLDWFARASDAGVTAAMINDVVVHKRAHARSTAHTSVTGTSDLLATLHEAVRRKGSSR